ncbi:MAG: metallophosphoesterase [Pyrinomonadaceae bacterium]
MFSRVSATPLEKYKKYITDDLQPFYADEEIAVLGINTARSLTIKDGRVNEAQVAVIREKLCALPNETLKVLVTHHPFDLPEGLRRRPDCRARRNGDARTITDCGADVFLAGHIHVSPHRTHGDALQTRRGRNALVVQAGTATSTRGRGEANSFNVIEFEHPRLIVKRLEWQSAERAEFAFAKTRRI